MPDRKVEGRSLRTLVRQAFNVLAVRVEPPETMMLSLAVDRAAQPIAGTLRDGDGAEYEFRGWVGLATALERALDASHPACREGTTG